MECCWWCKVEKEEDDFYLYRFTKFRSGREERSYLCKECSDKSHGDRWYPIIGYDKQYDISNKGTVRELRGNRYYNITRVQNANTQFVFLTKNGKVMKKNIDSLITRFIQKVKK
ncbi:NUMOD4 domain-containing protein [Bacillus sp. TL12]|uniref:NUMOD4 domain-containing protein n=1 Tax=Bacillus sp. TL12 TaxID=2894756 RepID=UPI001F52A5DC|nr:NUMOD4 domain-containing protein [Bacillus sp. TL12]MCI0767404.1 hypothetical protein [Bacillus sp. TL12]